MGAYIPSGSAHPNYQRATTSFKSPSPTPRSLCRINLFSWSKHRLADIECYHKIRLNRNSKPCRILLILRLCGLLTSYVAVQDLLSAAELLLIQRAYLRTKKEYQRDGPLCQPGSCQAATMYVSQLDGIQVQVWSHRGFRLRMFRIVPNSLPKQSCSETSPRSETRQSPFIKQPGPGASYLMRRTAYHRPHWAVTSKSGRVFALTTCGKYALSKTPFICDSFIAPCSNRQWAPPGELSNEARETNKNNIQERIDIC